MLQSMGSQGVGHDLVTEQQQNKIGFFSKKEGQKKCWISNQCLTLTRMKRPGLLSFIKINHKVFKTHAWAFPSVAKGDLILLS